MAAAALASLGGRARRAEGGRGAIGFQSQTLLSAFAIFGSWVSFFEWSEGVCFVALAEAPFSQQPAQLPSQELQSALAFLASVARVAEVTRRNALSREMACFFIGAFLLGEWHRDGACHLIYTAELVSPTPWIKISRLVRTARGLGGGSLRRQCECHVGITAFRRQLPATACDDDKLSAVDFVGRRCHVARGR